MCPKAYKVAGGNVSGKQRELSFSPARLKGGRQEGAGEHGVKGAECRSEGCVSVFGSVGLSFREIPVKLPHLSAALTTADLWLLGTIQASVLVFVCVCV